MIRRRWKKLENDLYNQKKSKFDLSKIPDIYDCAKFDLIHNKELPVSAEIKSLFNLSRQMADIIIPEEYGITAREKMDCGIKICHFLLQKIALDLQSAINSEINPTLLNGMTQEQTYSLDRQYINKEEMGGEEYSQKKLRTRLYFTSESHIHGLINSLRYCDLQCMEGCLSDEGKKYLSECTENDYLTHIVLKLFENGSYTLDDPDRYPIEIYYSPGAILPDDDDDEEVLPEILSCKLLRKISRDHLNLKTMSDLLEGMIKYYNDEMEGESHE